MPLGVNSCEVKNTYLVDVILPNRIYLANWQVAESEINSPGCEVLIGMDIIHNGDFSIANGTGKTIFTFAMPPFENPTDLFEKAIQINPRRR